ncbi:hypothetical protein D3C83_278230 [compost metagenome]
MDEVHSATQRALRATLASSPRMVAMSSAPTSGRKVMIDSRLGILFIEKLTNRRRTCTK